jgi:hypothetical protein
MITWAIAYMMTSGISMSMMWLFLAIVADISIAAGFKPIQINHSNGTGESLADLGVTQ